MNGNQKGIDSVSLQKMEELKDLSFYEESPVLALKYSDSLIFMANHNLAFSYLIEGYKNRAYAHMGMDDYVNAMDDAFRAMKIADSLNHPLEGATYNVIANIYSEVKDYDNAISYYRKAIELQLLKEPVDRLHLGATYFNLSDTYLRSKEPDAAVYYLNKSDSTFNELIDPDQIEIYEMQKPLLVGNRGVYYYQKGDNELAIPLIEQSAKELEDYHPLASSEYYNYLSELFQANGELDKALLSARAAINAAKKVNAKGEISKAFLHLSKVFQQQGNYEEAYNNFKSHKDYYDSTINLPTVQEMHKMRIDFVVANKDKQVAEAELKTSQRENTLYVSAGLMLLLIILVAGMFSRIRYVRKTSKIIEEEKDRSDALLKNILPDETAEELKAFGKVKAKQFDSVTVLFADFCGFTKYSSTMSPQELVERVDFYFSRFDQIMEKYDLEKIKTIGDAYMCASGLPYAHKDHVLRMVMAAFEMLDFVEKFRAEAPDDPTRFAIRIGINTGPVVAGVVGTKKFVYDIWGDTVNIASRMESNSEAGQINVSEDTYQLIKDHLDCTFRGMVDVKNKGMMKMYFVNPLSKDKKATLYKENGILV